MNHLPSAPPAPGCDDCRKRGHYCPGVVTADNGHTVLCLACDDGVPCERDRNASLPASPASPELRPGGPPPWQPTSPADQALGSPATQRDLAKAEVKLSVLTQKRRKRMSKPGRLSAAKKARIISLLDSKNDDEISLEVGWPAKSIARLRQEYLRELAAPIELPPITAEPRLAEPVYFGLAYRAAIQELERQRAAIDRAIEALRAVVGTES